jgi:hypothetical protein
MGKLCRLASVQVANGIGDFSQATRGIYQNAEQLRKAQRAMDHAVETAPKS